MAGGQTKNLYPISGNGLFVAFPHLRLQCCHNRPRSVVWDCAGEGAAPSCCKLWTAELYTWHMDADVAWEDMKGIHTPPQPASFFTINTSLPHHKTGKEEKGRMPLIWEEKGQGKGACGSLVHSRFSGSCHSTVKVLNKVSCPFLARVTPTSFLRAPAGILLVSQSSNLVYTKDKHILDCCD